MSVEKLDGLAALVITIVVIHGVANTVTVPVGQTGQTCTGAVAIGGTPQTGMTIGGQFTIGT